MKLKQKQSLTLTIHIILSLCLILSNSVQLKTHTKTDKNLKIQQSTKTIKQTSSVFIQSITVLMSKYNITNNNQYQNCFTADQMETLDQKIISGFDIGKQLSQNSIQTYPDLLNSFLNKNFKKFSLQCFFNSNDLSRLLLQFNIQRFEQLKSIFNKYSYQSYPKVHEYFSYLIQLIKGNNKDQLANYIALVMTKIYKQTLPNYADDQWGITALDPNLMIQPPYFGITNSNGLLGAISSKYPFELSQTVLAGTYDKYRGGRVQTIVQTMNVMDIELAINGRSTKFLHDLNFKQYIDFKKGQFSGSYSFLNKASIKYKYMALKNSLTAFYVVGQVTAHDDDITVSVANSHLIPQYLNEIEKQYESLPSKQIYNVITSKATTKQEKIDIVLSSLFFVDDASKKYLAGDNYRHWDRNTNQHIHTLQNIRLPKGQVFKFYLVSSLVSSRQHTDPKNQAIRLLLRTASTNPQLLVNKHYEMWGELWNSDIIIQGNSFDQKIVRSMVYHFYSFINQFKHYGLSPMGLSGLGYLGHVFWDMDLWMYPAILILNPKLAKSLIEYRYDRIQTARNNAFLNGYKGVQFPWESGYNGDQQTPVWAESGPLQHHVTGTVAVAAWKYYCVTKDLQWLKTKGRQIIEGSAEFWESRVQKDQNGTYHINNVVAADEWAAHVDDDAFTNGVAIQNLRIANKMRTVLGIDTNKDWDDIRQKIIIHKFPDTNVTKQYADYDGRNIKQADVNLLAYPLKQITDNAAILRDLQYYQKKIPIEGTPAMTHAMFALLYSRLGNAKKSYELFRYSFITNLLPPFYVMAEVQFGTNPYFITGAGGVLQSVIFGYGGVDITDQGVKKVQTVIPDEWSRVIIKSPVLNTTNTIKTFETQQK